MKILGLIVSFVLFFGYSYSQTCENYNRKLFHSLPDTFPNTINCIDKSELKQGWWIYYKVLYNPKDKPDELAKGDYVDDYTYGQFLNNRKVGTWTSVANVHLIYEYQQNSYYYTKDTTRIISWYGPVNSEVIYIKDSTIIKSMTSDSKENYLVCIECNKKDQKCLMSYNKKFIKEFPFKDFESEYEKTNYISDFVQRNLERQLKESSK